MKSEPLHVVPEGPRTCPDCGAPIYYDLAGNYDSSECVCADEYGGHEVDEWDL